MTKKDKHVNTERYMLRLPDGLRSRIQAKAASNGRSMNAELVDVLSLYFPEPKGAEDIVNDLAHALCIYEPSLREQAIDMLADENARERLKSRAEAYAYAERDRRNLFPWEDD